MVYRNRVIITVLLFVCAGGLWAQPYDKEYYFTRAQQYLSQGNLSGALEVYNTIIGFDPADAKAFNGRGLVYERRLDLNAAMMDYEHALELNPTYAEAQHNRASLLQKYKNEKPPSVTFAPQGISRNEMIFSQAPLPQSNSGVQARQSTAAQAYSAVPPPAAQPAAAAQPVAAALPSPPPSGQQAAQPQRQTAAAPQAAQTQGRRFTPPTSASEIARNEQWQPVQEDPPRYTPEENEVTPGYFRQDTGYGEDTRYLGPSNYPQPATTSRVDGTLVRITQPESPSAAMAASPPPRVRPARFPRPDDEASNQNNPPVFDITPARPEGSAAKQDAAETPQPAGAAFQPVIARAPAAVSSANQSYIPPPSYTQQSQSYAPPSYTQQSQSYAPPPYTQQSQSYAPPPFSQQNQSYAPPSYTQQSQSYAPPPFSQQNQSYAPPPFSAVPSATQNNAAGKSGAGQAGQTTTYPGNVIVTQNSANNTPAPSTRISPMIVTQNQGVFPADGGRPLQDAWAHNNTGLALFNAGKYEQAINEFDQAIKMAPNFALAYNNRGAAYAQTGQIRLAVDDFNNALRVNPYYADAQQNRELLLPILKNSGK